MRDVCKPRPATPARQYSSARILLVFAQVFLWNNLAYAENEHVGEIVANASSSSATASPVPQSPPSITLDASGTTHISTISIPFSSLASQSAKKHFLDFIAAYRTVSESGVLTDDIATTRRRLDDLLLRPGVDKLRSAFPVHIKSESYSGVQVAVITPAGRIPPRNKRRVLINLHGGGFATGAGLGGQMESIPIASLGSIKVVTVDYRQGPEHKFPAATEDVATVYRDLLKAYPPRNIGIYGCSAGGILTAESVAWFQSHNLPRPGAIGIFGAGALVPVDGDSNYYASALMGWPPLSVDAKRVLPYFDVAGLDIRDPLVSPAYSAQALARFPPSLLISGTRDPSLSSLVYTHSQLVKYGTDANLHIWEGAFHCSFAQPIVDPAVPETREAWSVTIKFFDKHLGM